MKPSPKKTASLPPLKTLAAALGVSVRRVSQLKAAGMPSDSIKSALAWKMTQPGVADTSAERLRAERILLVAEQRTKIRIENDVRRGELVTVGSVQASAIRMTSTAKGELMKLTSELPPQLVGLDAAAISKRLRSAITAVLTRLSSDSNEAYQTEIVP